MRLAQGLGNKTSEQLLREPGLFCLTGGFSKVRVSLLSQGSSDGTLVTASSCARGELDWVSERISLRKALRN